MDTHEGCELIKADILFDQWSVKQWMLNYYVCCACTSEPELEAIKDECREMKAGSR
jgi:hypothetical protein